MNRKITIPENIVLNGVCLCTFSQFVSFLVDSDPRTNETYEAAVRAENICKKIDNDGLLSEEEYSTLLALAVKPPKGYPIVSHKELGTFSIARKFVNYVDAIINAEPVDSEKNKENTEDENLH